MKLLSLFLISMAASTSALRVGTVRPLVPHAHTTDTRRVGVPSMALPQLAAKINLVALTCYGSALWLRPDLLMKHVMVTGEDINYHDTAYMLGQYLGAAYLAQAVRLFLALTASAISRSVLAPVFTLQLFLCVTTLSRLIRGTKNKDDALVLKIPLTMGQGLAATVCYLGMKACAA